jgi:hypothetical protein
MIGRREFITLLGGSCSKAARTLALAGLMPHITPEMLAPVRRQSER